MPMNDECPSAECSRIYKWLKDHGWKIVIGLGCSYELTLMMAPDTDNPTLMDLFRTPLPIMLPDETLLDFYRRGQTTISEWLTAKMPPT